MLYLQKNCRKHVTANSKTQHTALTFQSKKNQSKRIKISQYRDIPLRFVGLFSVKALWTKASLTRAVFAARVQAKRTLEVLSYTKVAKKSFTITEAIVKFHLASRSATFCRRA